MNNSFVLHNKSIVNNCVRVIDQLPHDGTIEVVIRPFSKKRTLDQNSLMWAGMTGDFAREGWYNHRQWTEEQWHRKLKIEFLPDCYEEGITLKDYVKWRETMDGELEMVGSTTKLTVKGMAEYIDRCYAYGAELGIRFTSFRYGN